MIDTNTRLVVMLDSVVDSIPQLIDEFEVMWETPFSPTDPEFPCTSQRPPDRPQTDRQDRLIIVNYNLNVGVIIHEIFLLVPNTYYIDQTNTISRLESVDTAVGDCIVEWGRLSNFILVDYVEQGNVAYSVMEAVARVNGIPWRRPQLNFVVASSSELTIGKVLWAATVMVWIR